MIFSINTEHRIDVLANVMGCKAEQLPPTYLGLPLGARKNDQKMWQGAPDRRNSKLVPCKRQYLSFWERLALVNSVQKTFLKMPATVEKKLNLMRNKFLWKGNAENRKFHLIRCQEVMKETKEVGLSEELEVA